MAELAQRDAFLNTLYDVARQDPSVILISADFGAPALDKFRRDLGAQFINVGIAEHNAITVGSGLALTGKKVFAYAIAPFLTLRVLEQIRVENAMMRIPITIVGVGAGLSYDDSVPTHHLIEDIAIMRALPHFTVHSVTDSPMAARLARLCCGTDIACYVRLDRHPQPRVYADDLDLADGMAVLRQGESYMIATGCMVQTAMKLAQSLEKDGISLGVIDAYRFPLNAPRLAQTLQGAKKLMSLEEHFLVGGLGSAVAEVLADAGMAMPFKRLGLPIEKGYCYKFGGREVLREYYGLDDASIERDTIAFLKG